MKQLAGRLIAAANSQCRFERSVFLLGHMRCGSTALSHVLTAHPEISGYGEAHIPYNATSALGVLTLNQYRRRAWKPAARHLFDKILHSRYDAASSPGLTRAAAIFLVRPPAQTIPSIRQLFAKLSSSEYATDGAAADYYEDRLTSLLAHWQHWPCHRRLGLTHASLTADPEAALARITRLLSLAPALANRYTPRSTMRPGAGDPLSSHRFTGIVPAAESSTLDQSSHQLDLAPGRLPKLQSLYEQLTAEFGR